MTEEEKKNLIELSEEAQGIAIALDSDRLAPTICKLERAYICGRRFSEKRITELEKQVEQKQRLADVRFEQSHENYKLFSDERKERIDIDIALEDMTDQLTKAKEIILRLYNAGRDVLMCRAEEKAYDNLSNAINDKSIEQFLKDIE